MSSEEAATDGPVDRYSAVRSLYGAATFDVIHRSRVLVVGAGGIGCELLKTLVLSGFVDLDVVDLDTIDVSNLNRQFLFRRSHVGHSKALIARDAVLSFNPSARIRAHHRNIKDSTTFSPTFFSSYSLVLNALDNIDARRHVNRLCLASSTPLIESGTQSTSGQVFPILPHISECYECGAIASPKTYAVCTIRSTPDRDVHCVAWAKHVFEALFGAEDEGNVMNDLRQTMRWEEERAEDSAEERARRFGRRLVDALFDANIEKALENKETWTHRKAPAPLHLSDFFPEALSSSPLPAFANPRSLDQSVLSARETLRFLFHSLTSLFSLHTAALGSLAFDKDVDVVMDVVSCLSNLRMLNFHIPAQSRFKVKGIAGNIIHAIATTNAIAAGLIVMEAVKLLASPPPLSPAGLRTCSSHPVFISPYKPNLLQPQPLDAPRPTCYICSHSTLTLHCDPATLTLRELYDQVLVRHLAFLSPSIDVFNRDNAIGTADDCEDDYLARPLDEVRCGEGAMIRVEDEAQQQEVMIMVRTKKWDSEEDRPLGFELTDKVEGGGQREVGGDGTDVDGKREMSDGAEQSKAAAVEEADDDLEIVEPESVRKEREKEREKQKAVSGGRRKRLHSPQSSESKRMRVEEVID